MNIAMYLPNVERMEWWARHLGKLLPEHTVLTHPAILNPSDIDIAVVWRPPEGWLGTLPNLQLTVSIGAGIDHIVEDPHYPANIPIVKTVGPDMIQRMREYIVLHVLRLHRQLPLLQQHQSQSLWVQPITPTATQRQVGIMGIGGMGKAAASSLSDLGFDVRCWSRSPRSIEGIQSFAGNEQLQQFLTGTEILVCLLPLTDETKHILCKTLFASLPQGASLINAARGQHLAEQDLLDALQDGQLSHATLDVFTTEPLPKNHAFWLHPQILVTPHVASLIDPVSGGQVIADNIIRYANGELLSDMTEVGKGY
jgi:glyoxylate/hydroxypyruvate reductase A